MILHSHRELLIADMVELLLKNQVDVLVETKDGWTALKIAEKNGYLEIEKLLRKSVFKN